MKDSFAQFKPISIKFIFREVPFWAIPFQKWGLFKKMGRIIKTKDYPMNVFCDKGKESLLQRMAGDGAKGEVTYLALGDGDIEPNKADETLGNELYRHIITMKEASGLILTTSTFIPSGEGNNEYKEMGLFGDNASATPDSGTIFTRLLINETKIYGQSLTIVYEIVAL